MNSKKQYSTTEVSLKDEKTKNLIDEIKNIIHNDFRN